MRAYTTDKEHPNQQPYLKVGDRVKSRFTGKVGTVRSFALVTSIEDYELPDSRQANEVIVRFDDIEYSPDSLGTCQRPSYLMKVEG